MNNLIFLGCNFFQENYVKCIVENKYNYRFYKDILNSNHYDCYTINDICSIDSGLCRFICEFKINNKHIYKDNIDEYGKFTRLLPLNGYQNNSEDYWLMILSTQDNKEKFLLDNLNI